MPRRRGAAGQQIHGEGDAVEGAGPGGDRSRRLWRGLSDKLEHGLEATDFFRPPALVYPFGGHVAVVEVDGETGSVKVLDYVSVDECGVRITPNLVRGQVHGGLAQGIAQARWEHVSTARTAS